jgi:FAD/FMN-containing dehydrogenase
MIAIDQLVATVGPNHVLTGDDVAARSVAWGRDMSSGAAAIVRPASVEELAALMKQCNESGQAIVPHGGRTGLVYGCVAQPDHIAVSLERLNAIEEIDTANRSMRVQAGVTLQDAQEAAAEAGLYFPVDLGARGSAMIGGNISTNAGGLNVVRYGMMRDNVLGLEAVLADGTVVSSLNSLIKNNSGYDLKHLFVGTEGTLGIVTRAVLRLRPQPLARHTAMLAVNAYGAVTQILNRADQQLNLTSFEVLWDAFFQLSIEHHATGDSPFEQRYPYYVLLEASGSDSEHERERFEQVMMGVMEADLAVDAVIAQSEQQRSDLWKIRENVEPLMTPGSVHFDISLPVGLIDDYLGDVIERVRAGYPDADLYPFGHLGDNNVHLVIARDDADETFGVRAKDAAYECLQRYRGAVSAEHGIGLDKKAYLGMCRSPEELDLMRRLKRSLDPNNILNPGKIFDL